MALNGSIMDLISCDTLSEVKSMHLDETEKINTRTRTNCFTSLCAPDTHVALHLRALHLFFKPPSKRKTHELQCRRFHSSIQILLFLVAQVVCRGYAGSILGHIPKPTRHGPEIPALGVPA